MTGYLKTQMERKAPPPQVWGLGVLVVFCVAWWSQAESGMPSFSLFAISATHFLPHPIVERPFPLVTGTQVAMWRAAARLPRSWGTCPGSRLTPPFPRSPSSHHYPGVGSPCQFSLSGFLLAYSSPLLNEDWLWHQSQRKGIKRGNINRALREDKWNARAIIALGISSNLIIPI